MDTPTLVAKILAVYLAVSGLFILIKGKTLPHLLRDFFDHPAVSYLSGIILIFLSSMYLIQYNIWDGSWKTIVTVLVWLIAIKGLFYIFAPKALSNIYNSKTRALFNAYSVLAIIVGVYIFFFLG